MAISEDASFSFGFSGMDLFNESSIIDTIINRIESYLSRQILGSLIPITISYDGRKPRTINKGYWYKENDKNDLQFKDFKQVDIKGITYFYSIDEDKPSIFVYNTSENSMTHLEFCEDSKKAGSFKYLYKGIGILGEYTTNPYFSGFIDILGKKVEETLQINRRNLIEEFDKETYFEQRVKEAIHISLLDLDDKTYSIYFKKDQFKNYFLSVLQYMPMEDALVHEFLGSIVEIKELISPEPISIKNISYDKETGIFKKSSNLPDKFYDRLYALVGKGTAFLIETNSVADFEFITSTDEFNKAYQNHPDFENFKKIWEMLQKNSKLSYIPLEKADLDKNGEVRYDKMLSDLFGKEVYVVSISSLNINLKIYCQIQKKYIPERLNIDFDEIARREGRSIIENANGYDKLLVSDLPFSEKKIRKFKSEGYLILPFTNLLTEKIKTSVSNGINFKDFYTETFDERIFNSYLSSKDNKQCINMEDTNKETKELYRLILWVYHHQMEKYKYTFSEIKEEYERLLLNYYNSML